MTPLQAGVLLFLRNHPEAKVTDAADALVVRVPTVSDVLNDLVRKRWVTKRYSVEDRRVVCVQRSRRGHALALQIEERVPQVNATLAEEEPRLARTPSLATLPQYASLRDPHALLHLPFPSFSGVLSRHLSMRRL